MKRPSHVYLPRSIYGQTAEKWTVPGKDEVPSQGVDPRQGPSGSVLQSPVTGRVEDDSGSRGIGDVWKSPQIILLPELKRWVFSCEGGNKSLKTRILGCSVVSESFSGHPRRQGLRRETDNFSTPESSW